MKKILLAAVILLITSSLVVFAAPKAKKGAAPAGAAPFVVDLKTLTQVKVIDQSKSIVAEPIPGLRSPALAKAWDGYFIKFPENFVDVTKYQRVTITLKYFDKDGNELKPADSMGMLVVVRDVAGDWHKDGGPNLAFKELNVGGYSGMVNKEKGVRHNCTTAPAGIFIQRAQDARVVFIELTGMIFHNSDFKFTDPQPEGSGPEGS